MNFCFDFTKWYCQYQQSDSDTGKYWSVWCYIMTFITDKNWGSWHTLSYHSDTIKNVFLNLQNWYYSALFGFNQDSSISNFHIHVGSHVKIISMVATIFDFRLTKKNSHLVKDYSVNILSRHTKKYKTNFVLLRDL